MSTFNLNNAKGASLTAEQVIDIFLRGSGKRGFRETQRALSLEYNVGTETIGRILRRETWKSITRPYWEDVVSPVTSYTPSEAILEKVRQDPEFQAMQERLMKVGQEIQQLPVEDGPPKKDLYATYEGLSADELIEKLKK